MFLRKSRLLKGAFLLKFYARTSYDDHGVTVNFMED